MPMSQDATVQARAMLLDLYGRVDGHVTSVLENLTLDDLVWRPSATTNSIAWLIWHLARVQDHHLSEITGDAQVWTCGVWAENFGLEPDPLDTGYGHSPEQVDAVRPRSVASIGGYHRRVHEQVVDFVATVTDTDLARVVDTRWDPPVTMAVRLVSMADDAIQHAGAAGYLKGLLTARTT